MPLTSLKPILEEAETRHAAALGLVCLGWGDADAFVAAGIAAHIPVILQAGPAARAHIPIRVWAAMFRTLASATSVPIAAHLDHGADADACFAALDAGFTSVMFDGSRLPLKDNVRETARVAERARAYGATSEAEIGFVGYAEGEGSRGTSPDEARALWEEAGPDCLAVSAGNVHLHRQAAVSLDFERLGRIRDAVPCPLVLHGGSGIPASERQRAAREFRVRKINLGTELRQVYGGALRARLAADPSLFDRIKIEEAIAPALQAGAEHALKKAWEGTS